MIHFGVDGKDVFKFLREQKSFLDPDVHWKRQQHQFQVLGERMAREVFGPAYEAIDRGRPLNRIQFSPRYLEFKGRLYKVWLPFNLASECRAHVLDDRAALHCPTPGVGTANHSRATGLFFHGVNLASLTFEEARAK